MNLNSHLQLYNAILHLLFPVSRDTISTSAWRNHPVLCTKVLPFFILISMTLCVILYYTYTIEQEVQESRVPWHSNRAKESCLHMQRQSITCYCERLLVLHLFLLYARFSDTYIHFYVPYVGLMNEHVSVLVWTCTLHFLFPMYLFAFIYLYMHSVQVYRCSIDLMLRLFGFISSISHPWLCHLFKLFKVAPAWMYCK